MSDTAVHWNLPPPADLFAPAPFQAPRVLRYSGDRVDILIVLARRRRDLDVPPPGQTNALHMIEERLLVAERPAGTPAAPYRIAWSRYAAFEGDQASSEDPVLVVRLGSARRLTLLTQGQYSDGAGGLFVTRVAPGRWVRAASWYSGC